MKDEIKESLTVKYKPTSIDSIEHGRETINKINKDNIRKILIKGPSGCGKTTLARMIAKEYAGDSIGIIDMIDIVNVEIISAIENKLKNKPSQENAVIIEDCDLLTKKAQDIIADKLQNINKNILVILCSTSEDKISNQLISAVDFLLHVDKPLINNLYHLLENVCKAEDKDYDKEGLNLIIEIADCTIRQAINLLDSVIHEKGNAKYKSVADLYM